MTDKLYMKDTYTKDFTAEITGAVQKDGKYHVTLSRSAFYAEGGGQPCDVGDIGGVKVLNVYEQNGEQHHVLNNMPCGDPIIKCSVDWSVRFDHMQQHLGQHILSAVLWQRGYSTVGFHMGSAFVTIDLDKAISPEELASAELEANAMVLGNHPVSIVFPTDNELEQMPLRKQPQVGEGIRVIVIEGLDYSPCGGTHPKATGEVGLIKVLSCERYKGAVRLSFVCGNRAFLDYRVKNDITSALCSLLSAKEDGLVAQVTALLANVKVLQKDNDQLKHTVLLAEAAAIAGEAETKDGVAFVIREYKDRDFAEIRIMAGLLADIGAVALLGIAQDGMVKVALACPKGISTVDMAALLKQTIAKYGGKGGGNPWLAQGTIGCPEGAEVLLNEMAHSAL